MNPDYGRLRQSKQKDCFEKEVNIEREKERELERKDGIKR